MRRAYWQAAFLLALGATTRLGAQGSPDVTTEFLQSRGQTLVEMAKMPLDRESKLGAFYGFDGRVKPVPAPEVTLHLVHSSPQWAYAFDYTVVMVLDDKSRMPLPRARRSSHVGEGYQLEQIMMPLSREQAAQIARANKVEMKVGPRAFVWSDTLQRAFRQIVASAGGSAQ
jgi:hypothetical protein